VEVEIMNPFERNIVVGVDGYDDSLAAVDLAAAEADARGLPLLLLSAHPLAGTVGPHLTLTAIMRRVCTIWPGVRTTARNITADPADALIKASRRAALVVTGRRGHMSDDTPGSVSAEIAAHAMCPTIVVPQDAPALTDQPVLLALGMSPDDETVAGVAFEEASLRGVPLVATHVWSGVPATAVASVDPFAYDLRRAEESADRLIAETLAGWSSKYPDVEVRRMPLYDTNPAQALLDASDGAGLLVVGARRYGRRSSMLLGTLTRALLRRAARPVAVVSSLHHH
jgi:nucleotide-binding universal stress UspA family protein